MTSESVELRSLFEHGLTEEHLEPTGPAFALKPADGGKDAWLFLCAACMIEALVWGFPFSFGLFQEYYSTHGPFAHSNNIAVIGTLQSGVMYLTAPLTFGSMQKWPQIRRPGLICGLVCMCVSLGLSGFAQTITQLMVIQGVMYAIGGGLAYAPCILYMNEWFVRRRGLAFGVMWAGTGVAGVVLPLLFQQLLGKYGFRTTLRIWSIAVFVLVAPLAYFLKPRIPLSQRQFSAPRPEANLTFLRMKSFMLYQVDNTLQALGFFLPMIWLPTYAQQYLHASSLAAAFTVVAINVASVFGCVLMGVVVDRYHITTGILVSTIGTTVGVFLLWGLSTNLPVLYLFCITYGLFAGSFTATWTGVIKSIQADNEVADAGLVLGFLAFGRGLGNVASGPLSEALVKSKPWLHEAAASYGSGFGPLIAFTGVTALLSGSSFVGRRIGWL